MGSLVLFWVSGFITILDVQNIAKLVACFNGRAIVFIYVAS